MVCTLASAASARQEGLARWDHYELSECQQSAGASPPSKPLMARKGRPAVGTMLTLGRPHYTAPSCGLGTESSTSGSLG